MQEFIEDVKKAVEVMRQGGIILYPTDTIWGIGCDASNSAAVRRIFELKRRSDSKSMLSLIDSDAKLGYYVPDIPDVAYDLMDLAEKPLTIIYDNVRHMAPELIADDGSAGIRITREEFSRELCRRMGVTIKGKYIKEWSAKSTANVLVVPYRTDETYSFLKSSIDMLIKIFSF